MSSLDFFSQELFNQPSRQYELRKGEILFSQGADVKGLYLIEQGLVKVSQKNEQGKVIFVRLAIAPDTVGHRSIFIHKTYSGTAEVLSDYVVVRFYTVEEVSKLLTLNQNFARHLIYKISSELQKTEQDMLNTKQKTLRGRLATFLLNLSKTHSDIKADGSVLLKSEIAKNVISQILLTADETVIRLMTEMKNEGLISYENRKIMIMKPSDLEKAAEL